jgi:ankyrin repeat protein
MISTVILSSAMVHAVSLRVFKQDGQVMLPLSYMSQWLEATMDQSPVGGGITLRLGKRAVTVHANKKSATVNGKVYNLPTSPVTVNEQLYIPVKLLVDGFGVTVAPTAEGLLLRPASGIGQLVLPDWIYTAGPFTPLHLDICANAPDLAERHLHPPTAIHAMDSLQRAPLHWAVLTDHSEMVNWLLSKGVDRTLADVHGATALHLAAAAGKVTAAEALLVREVNLLIAEKHGHTPLHLAAAGGHTEMVKLLLTKGAQQRVLNNAGFTPLHVAVMHGRLEVAQMLLDNGGDILAKGYSWMTPLHVVRDTTMAALLLDNGAEVDARDKSGATPIFHIKDSAIITMLLDRGAEINITDQWGETPLHQVSRADIATQLLQHGADMNAVNNDGWTPLHTAAYAGYLDVVKVLLARGANAEARDAQGLTPLAVAIAHPEVRALLEHAVRK